MSFGVAVISLTYLLSFMFNDHQSAFRHIGTIYVAIGFFTSGIAELIVGLNKGNSGRIYFMMNPFLAFFESMIYVIIK